MVASLRGIPQFQRRLPWSVACSYCCCSSPALPLLLLLLLLLLWQVANFRHGALPDGGATDYRLQLQLARLTSNSESESDVVYAAGRAGEAQGKSWSREKQVGAGRGSWSREEEQQGGRGAGSFSVCSGRCSSGCSTTWRRCWRRQNASLHNKLQAGGEEELEMEMAMEELAQLEKEGHKISRCCRRCFCRCRCCCCRGALNAPLL